jgi:hypothetical protein
MIFLTSLITTWIEHCTHYVPYSQPRAYADDLSLCTKARTKAVLIDQTKKMHQVTADFIQDAGMAINLNKSFTFGHEAIASCLRRIPTHKKQFRLVGGLSNSMTHEIGQNLSSLVQRHGNVALETFGIFPSDGPKKSTSLIV